MNTKFALVNNVRTEAEKGLTGICPFCGSAMIAKCGNIRMKHWAHKAISECDSWSEGETEWHRQWKNHFDASWQEFIFKNKTSGEKHIADVYTEHGLVVEFQHSPIDAEEQKQREQFYENMIWVLDGSRLKRDYQRFLKGKQNFKLTRQQGLFMIDEPADSFPPNWVKRAVPVVLDFMNLDSTIEATDIRQFLYCLMPKNDDGFTFLYLLTRESFIQNIKDGKWFGKQQSVETQPSELTASFKRQQSQRRSSNYVVRGGKFIPKRRF